MIQKRSWVLIWFGFFAFAEFLSLMPVPDRSWCLIEPPHYQQATNNDNPKNCPAFHTGIEIALAKTDHFLEVHDKSVLGAFTIVLAFSTIGLWLATNKLWQAGERQMELIAEGAAAQARDMKASIKVAIAANEHSHAVFVATQRPWLSVSEIIPIGQISFKNNMHLPFALKIKNGGNSPAINVVWNASTWLYFLGGNPQELQAAYSRKLIGDRIQRAGANIGHLLVPGDTLDTGTLTHRLDMTKVTEPFNPIIVGCLDYRFPGEDSYHQTGFMFQMTRTASTVSINDAGQDARTFNPGQVFSANEIRFEPFSAGFFAT